jgi:hypothetical protein
MADLRASSIGLLAGFLCLIPEGRAQLTTGTLEGFVENRQRQPAASISLEIESPLGRVMPLTADSQGRFSAALPYGDYTVRSPTLEATCHARIRPLATTRCGLRPGEDQIADVDAFPLFTANNTAQLLLLEAPSAGTYPLDFASLGSTRLPLIAGPSAAQWTGTSFRLSGLDATDSYQPGIPVMMDDLASLDSVAVREAYTAGALPLDAYDAAVFLRGAASSWHFGIATQDTGAALAEIICLRPRTGEASSGRTNSAGSRGTPRTSTEFSVAGPTSPRWPPDSGHRRPHASGRTAPQSAAACLFGNVRGRVRLSSRDQMDALYSGSRVDLSSGGWPAGMEAFLASPLMPSFYGVSGFENLREVDHFDLVQTGWTHQFDGARVLEVRYGYSTAHLDTAPVSATGTAGVIDLSIRRQRMRRSPTSRFARGTNSTRCIRPKPASQDSLTGSRWAAILTPRSLAIVFKRSAAGKTITVVGQPAFLVRLKTPADTRESHRCIQSECSRCNSVCAWRHAGLCDCVGCFARRVSRTIHGDFLDQPLTARLHRRPGSRLLAIGSAWRL